MSRDDPSRPSHASGKEYTDALSGLIEERKEEGRSRQGGRSGAGRSRDSGDGEERQRKESSPFVVFVLVVVLAGIVGYNVHVLTRPVEPGPPQLQRRAASVKLYHAAKAVESYRAERGALPADLSALNIPRGDFEYVRADTGYTLSLQTQDTYNQYRSGSNIQELLARAGIAGRGGGGGGDDEGGGDADEG